MTGQLAGRVALITGAGSGIGRATALRFAHEGARVVVADADEAGASETVRLVGAAGGTAQAVVGNVTRAADAQRMVELTLRAYGTLDILINNAGITRDALTLRLKDDQVQKMGEDQWDEVVEVNLKGTFLVSQAAALPMIRQKQGRIVNTASVASLGNIGQANYAASKAGVIGLTKTLALEWARYGIRVNCIAPGGVKTRMTAAIPEKVMAGLIEKIPLHRMAEPEEIAAVHLFLSSDEASYITGQVIWIDGGLTVGA